MRRKGSRECEFDWKRERESVVGRQASLYDWTNACVGAGDTRPRGTAQCRWSRRKERKGEGWREVETTKKMSFCESNRTEKKRIKKKKGNSDGDLMCSLSNVLCAQQNERTRLAQVCIPLFY